MNNHRVLPVSTLCLLSLLTACASDETTEPVPEPSPEAPGPAAIVIQEHCGGCHTAGGIAPYPFDTHAQTAPLADLIKEAVTARTMPPMNANNDGSCHTFDDAAWLDEVALAAIVDWVDEGTPDRGWYEPVLPEPMDIGADASLPTPSYEVNGDSDDYRCFVLDLDFDDTRYLTAFDLIPGEPEVVHHMVAFAPANAEAAAEALSRDDAEPGEGYTCFGDAGVEAGIVAAWAPGLPAVTYPEDTGIPIDGSRKLIVQMHYYPGAEPKTDSSTLDLRLVDDVKFPARIGGSGDFDLALAPGSEQVDTAHSFKMVGQPTNTVHAVIPHMHKRGRSLRLDLRDEEGSSCMVDVPRWDFDWQRFHFYETPLLVSLDQVLELRCGFDTAADSDVVVYGEGTDDEMCISFLYITGGVYPGAQKPAELVEVEALPSDPPTGSAPGHVWAQRHGGTGWDGLRALAPSADGGVFGFGWLEQQGSPDVGQGGDLGFDMLVTRHGADGTLTYSRGLGGDDEDWLIGGAAAPDGGAYVSGYTKSATWSLDGIDLEAQGDNDWLVAALDANGTARWAHRIGGTAADGGRGVASHPDGGFVSLSFHDDRVDLEGISYGVDGERHSLVVHWNDDGTVSWVETLPTPGGFLNAVAVAPDGAVHAVGEVANGPSSVAGVSWTRAADGSSTSTATYTAMGFGWFNDLALGADGTVYVAANFTGPTAYLDVQPFESGIDGAVVALDVNGDASLVASFTGPGNTRVRSLAVDESGAVVVAGSFHGELHHGEGTWRAAGGEDVFVAALSGGATAWLQTFGSYDHDLYPIVAPHGEGTFLTFEAQAPLHTGPQALGAVGGEDIVVMALE